MHSIFIISGGKGEAFQSTFCVFDEQTFVCVFFSPANFPCIRRSVNQHRLRILYRMPQHVDLFFKIFIITAQLAYYTHIVSDRNENIV